MNGVLPDGYALRGPSPDDATRLIAVEVAADALFALHGYEIIAHEGARSLAEMRKLLTGNDITVASTTDGTACGFTVADEFAGHYWLRQIAVDPAHGRRGLGAALLRGFLDQGLARGCRAAALSTFRDVPFNAPFYRRNGFRELSLDRVPTALAARFDQEVPAGVSASDRVLMTRAL